MYPKVATDNTSVINQAICDCSLQQCSMSDTEEKNAAGGYFKKKGGEKVWILLCVFPDCLRRRQVTFVTQETTQTKFREQRSQ